MSNLLRLSFTKLNENTKQQVVGSSSNDINNNNNGNLTNRSNASDNNNNTARSNRSEQSSNGMNTGRTNGTDDDYLYPDEEDPDPNNRSVSKFVNKQAKRFIKNFIDYGPPYVRNNKAIDYSLVNECSKPILNHFELHAILNTRMDPNIHDPEDLHYTPLHWCARNLHLLGKRDDDEYIKVHGLASVFYM